jgi:hypothetical protein
LTRVFEIVNVHHHLVALTIPFPNQARSADGPAINSAAADIGFAAIELFPKLLQALDGLAA